MVNYFLMIHLTNMVKQKDNILSHLINLILKKNSYKIKPNYNFDLCRLAITILDVINFDKDVKTIKIKVILFIFYMV